MTDHDPICLEFEYCICAQVSRARADERERATPVIDAARTWVERIVDPPNLWADAEDFALIKAVEALDE